MSLKSTTQVEKNRYQLEVLVDAEEFEKAVAAAYHKESKKITIPGFRKGKAPRKFIEKYYGENVFYDEAINSVYPGALEQAIEEAKLEMIEDKIDFDLVSADKEGLVFKATITTKPEVEIEGYKGIPATKKISEVADADVDAEIEKVRDRNSRMVTVEDREAQNGDTAVIDFDGYVDGEAFSGGKAENYSLQLGSGQFIPGFEDQVIGHKSGDEFEVNVKFPEDYGAEELAGKEAVFKIKLHEIKMKELPQVDDDFVKDVSEFDTLDAYRADIREKLTKAREEKAKDDLDNKLIDEVVSRLKAEIPEAMYENRINDDLRDFSYRLQSQGLNVDTYMKYTGQDKDAIRGQFRPQAERQVKLRLALEKIAELEGIVPADEDVEQEYAKLAESYKMDSDKVKSLIRKEDLVQDIAVEKAFDLVRGSAVVAEEKE
ncbi:Trigger factor [Caprobacter fermentans]|uniref:Trigger factor n=1 Tax=Caproicibacter fermentans TaxID=2576756 RepID=A0A6N8I600_9FIRM|nr:trigger factor [Caproicibacter fermentans]MVB12933.1 Trigger factor [Caproicibacter fermentans]OCN02411.1 trigger factor [Clostridium sp. W14A]QNK41321.1 trigger factor [Caproicibacter fermentans]